MRMSTAQSHPPVSPTARQERYWLSLAPLLPDLTDWDLSLLALLVLWSGPKVPGDTIYKSWQSIGPRIGSKRAGGSRPADKHVLRAAAAHLVQLGLVTRSGTDAAWKVIPRDAPAVEPRWSGCAKFNARLWRREYTGPMSARAGISRLTFYLDEQGRWRGSVAELGEILQVKSPLTIRRRVIELAAVETDLEIRESWEQERAMIEVYCKFEIPATDQELDGQIERVRDQLWYPELVDEAVARAGRLLKSGRVSRSRQLSGFYQPILDLQTETQNAPLVKYALQETLDKGVLDGTRGQSSTRNWHHYTRKVAANNSHRFRNSHNQGAEVVTGPTTQSKKAGKVSKQPNVKRQEPSLRERELAIRELLGEAAQLNGAGKHKEARELMSEQIVPQANTLTELFAGNQRYCKEALVLAFKQGVTDFVGVSPDEYALDFLPEWTPKQWPPR